MKICTFPKRTRNGRNEEMSWAEFCERISRPFITSETMAEYRSFSKAEKTEAKDVGGFIGGFVRQGVRKAENVTERSLIVLDLDYAHSEVHTEVLHAFNAYAYCLYPTHSKTPQGPRYRLVMPLERTVSPEEYEPVCRWIASQAGIEQFDHTGYQFSRLMFWPSIPKDSEYDCDIHDGHFIDPDSVLALYDDWKDISCWPKSEREGTIQKRTLTKAEDPMAKKGLVGAFCRAYTVTEAIHEFLADVYEPAGERFTYAEGTTASGVVIYEDRWAYSNHATDPAGGRLCNAFDLVRIHKFGHLDGGENLPVNRQPSYVAMTDFCIADRKTKSLLIKERGSASDDFDSDFDEWQADLSLGKSGQVLSTIQNTVMILEHDEDFRGLAGMDLMKCRPVKLRQPSWNSPDDVYWTDADDAQVRMILEHRYGIRGKSVIDDALTIVFQNHAFHPVRDYLESLEWDGHERIEELFIRVYGVPDSHYARECTRKVFAGAVARVMEPGIKNDQVCVLVGPQGIGKSRFLRGMFDPWFTDTLTSISGKEAYEAIDGIWCAEMAEMTAARKAELDQLKGYISACEDTYRKAYDRRTGTYKRQCIFIGTTNEWDCLKDYTGNRRFWPMRCRPDQASMSVEQALSIRGQLWAEACQIWKDGEDLFLDADTEQEAERIRKSFTSLPESWNDIQNYLDTPLPEDWSEMKEYSRTEYLSEPAEKGIIRSLVSAKEIWVECFRGNSRNFSRADQKNIISCLHFLGWERLENRKYVPQYGKQRVFTRPKINNSIIKGSES